MPQASPELRAMWADERVALDYLEGRGIHEVRNGILLIPAGKTLDEKDGSAIDYLIDEWDFTWIRR